MGMGRKPRPKKSKKTGTTRRAAQRYRLCDEIMKLRQEVVLLRRLVTVNEQLLDLGVELLENDQLLRELTRNTGGISG